MIKFTNILASNKTVENKFCSPLNMQLQMTSTTLDEAIEECFDDPFCKRFYYDGCDIKYFKCTDTAQIKDSGCGSIVYTRGNHRFQADIIIE